MIELEPFIFRHGAMRSVTACAFAVALMLTPTPVHGETPHLLVAVAVADTPSVASAPLRIDVEPSIDDANLIPGWIQGRNPSVAEEIPSIEGHAQWIAVTIAGATYDYRITVMAIRDGAPLGAVKDPVVCECNSESLLELVDARIDEELAALRAAPRPEEVVWDITQRQSGITDAQGMGCAPTGRPRPSPMGHTGLALGVLGAGLLATGIQLALRQAELRGVPGRLEGRAMQDTGIGLAVGGGAALAAGMSLLVVDLVRQRKGVVAVTPVLDHRQRGIAITWRTRGGGRR